MAWEDELMRTERRCVVVFRLVVFRPFTSEVVLGKVKSSDEDGIRGVLRA